MLFFFIFQIRNDWANSKGNQGIDHKFIKETMIAGDRQDVKLQTKKTYLV